MKRIMTVLLALSVLLFVPLTAYAQDVPQARDDCSIEVAVRFDGENVDGGTLAAIKVGYVNEKDGDYFFSQVMTNIVLENITSTDAPQTQKAFYENNQKNYDFYVQTQSVKNGKATFSGLPTGLYLIIQEKPADGFTKMDPFLVSVPYLEDGEYQYHVTAAIKSELEREPDTKPTTPPPTKPDDPQLPQTGQLNWPIPLMVAAGLALFLSGWVLCFGKKSERYEN